MALDDNGVPVRRGVPKQFTIDHDAVQVLEALAAGPKAQGRLISELLRAEVCRREERARMRQAVEKALAEPVGVSDE